MKKYVYLCGQITGLSYQEARYGWRQQVVEAMADTDAICLSPMRAKAHLSDRTELSKWGDPDSVLSCPRGLTTRDRFDVQRSQVLFANFMHMGKISVGSMIEFGWADALRIPILCCMEEGNLHEHAMVADLIGWRCTSLEEGIEVLQAVMSEGM